MKKIKFSCIYVLAIFIVVGCSSSKSDHSVSVQSPMMMAQDTEMSNKIMDQSLESTWNEPPTQVITEAKQRKRILSGNYTINSTNFDQDTESINQFVVENDAYFEQSNLNTNVFKSNIEYRVKNLIIKVPVENYENLKDKISTIGKVTNSSESEQDITGQYYDLESSLNLKLEEEKRLMELSAIATKIEDIIAIEQKLAEVKTAIELYKSQLTSFDSQVSYSTLYVDVYEVLQEEIDVNFDEFGNKVSSGFKNSINVTIRFFENVIVFISFAFVPLTIFLVFVLIIFKIIKFFKRKSKKIKNK